MISLRALKERSTFVHGALFVAFTLAFFFVGTSSYRKTYVNSDAEEYLMLAYNLAHYGVYSDRECGDDPNCARTPRAYRAPAYPFILAIGIRLRPSMMALPQQALKESANLDPLRQDGLLFVYLAALVSFFVTRRLTRSTLASYAILLVVGFNPLLIDYPNEMYPEHVMAFLLVLLGWLTVLGVEKRKLRFFLGMGAVLGSLCLINPIWQYLSLIFPLYFFYALRGEEHAWRLWIVRSALYALAATAVVGPYIVRNYIHFGRPIISLRGGPNLLMRAEKSQMRNDEIIAAFFYWSNCECIRKLRQPFENDPSMQRLIRGKPGSFYTVSRTRRSQLEREIGEVAADVSLKKEAVEKILSNPLRHLLVSIPIFYRGMAVQQCVVDFILFGSAIAVLGWALLRSREAVVGLLLPSAFSYSFYSFITYNLPRYSYPLVPVLWICAALVTVNAARYIFRGRAVGNQERASV